ncbi:hypothetical protein Hanom_Chr11g01052561 [Helianthus anomalus]
MPTTTTDVTCKLGRGKRGPATFSKKDCDYTIEFNHDNQPIGKNATDYTSWLGVKMKAEFSYHIPQDKFEEHKWEHLWMDIQVLYIFVCNFIET